MVRKEKNMFWFKRNKIVVDAFVHSDIIYELSKIDYAHKFFPQGWKSLPATKEIKAAQYQESKAMLNIPTIKKCPGFNNLFSKGFIIPSWTDMVLEDVNGNIQAFDPTLQQRTEAHPNWAWWPELYEGYAHVKIISPWLLSEKSGIHFVYHQCDWHNTDRIANFHVLSAIIDYKAQNNTHINVFMKKGTIINIQHGDPLVHIVPITEKEVELKTHRVDEKEYSKIMHNNAGHFMWSGQHRALYNAMKEKESKCPFGFGKK